jgi:hypothetical protein
MLSSLLLALVVAQAAPAASGASGQEPEARPAITIHKTEGPDASVSWLNIPWGPETFASMERPADGFYNRRSWPFARLESKRALRLDGTEIPAGNYALVFHPNDAANEGMSLEVRRISVPEFLQEGNVMTRTPEGETVWRAPVRFDTAAGTSPALKIDVVPEKGGFQLKVQYGDRWTSKEFLR